VFGQIRLELTMEMEKGPPTCELGTGGLKIVTIANTAAASLRGPERHNYATSVCD
jgi:hypothetical protein